jgi:hypothetical protein
VGRDAVVAAVAVDAERVAELWPAVVEHVRESGAEVLSTYVQGAKVLSVDAEKAVITIGLPQDAAFNKRKAEAKANVERIAESVQAIVGERFRPVYELVDGEPEPVADGPGMAPMSEEEIIDLIKTNFDASEVVPEEQAREEGAG